MLETMKKHKWKLLVSTILILLPVLAGVLLWDRLPDPMATHWAFDGEANGWMSRDMAVFGLPMVLLVLSLICLMAEERNFERNPKPMNLVFWICPAISILGGAAMYSYALGIDFSMQKWAMALLGAMFIAIGNYLPKCRQNRTLGIKLKWTYESEANWNATHRFGGRVWVIGGALMMASLLLPEGIADDVMVVLMLAVVLIPVVYSWRYASKEAKEP